MMEGRCPFRFNTGANDAPSASAWAAIARKIESLGYSTLLHPDHFGGLFGPFTALLAAAQATKTLRVGTYVLANSFWHPAVIAREAATLDILSGGRLQLGLGAGYMASDYTQTGIPCPPPGERVNRLEEMVRIVKGLFGTERVTFSGQYYTITDMNGFPKPIQVPHPPILIGGGSKRVLSLAAREADIISLVMKAKPPTLDLADCSLSATERQVEWIRAAAGDRFESLTIDTLVFGVAVTDHRQQAAEEIAKAWGIADSKQVLDSTHFLIGSVNSISDEVQMWRERFGISSITVFGHLADAFAPIVARLAGK